MASKMFLLESHSWVSLFSPAHSSPPFNALGLLHSRVLLIIPGPVRLEHSDQLLQSDQPPSTILANQ